MKDTAKEYVLEAKKGILKIIFQMYFTILFQIQH